MKNNYNLSATDNASYPLTQTVKSFNLDPDMWVKSFFYRLRFLRTMYKQFNKMFYVSKENRKLTAIYAKQHKQAVAAPYLAGARKGCPPPATSTGIQTESGE